jgi:cell division protein FtsN
VPELTHDTAEDGFHEIQLSGKQLVFVGMTVTIVFVAIFLCGVLVGRNTRPPREGDTLETASTTPPAAPSTSTAAGPPTTEPPAPPVEDELSYPKRLEGKPAPEQLKPTPQQPAARPTTPAPSSAAPPALDVPTSGKPGTWYVQVSALRNGTVAAGQVKRLIGKGYPAYLELPARGTDTYRVRVGLYRDRREADQVARRLKEDKFEAVVRR